MSSVNVSGECGFGLEASGTIGLLTLVDSQVLAALDSYGGREDPDIVHVLCGVGTHRIR